MAIDRWMLPCKNSQVQLLTWSKIKSHERCVRKVNTTSSTWHLSSTLTATQDQAQIQMRTPQHVFLRILYEGVFTRRISTGQKHHPPDVCQAGALPSTTHDLLCAVEKEQQVHSQFHSVTPWPQSVPKGGKRQCHNQASHSQSPSVKWYYWVLNKSVWKNTKSTFLEFWACTL